jgi:nucleoside-triphosphatase THEP1
MPESRILIVTGEIGSGKSTFCMLVIDQARQAGLRVTGLLSPAVFEEDEKTGIQVVDLGRGASRRLAWLRSGQARAVETKRWSFDPEAVAWGGRVLSRAVPTELLVIDELGPLEFERGEGWMEGLRVLDEGEYRAALVVIRPSLVSEAQSRWPGAEVLSVVPGDDLESKARSAWERLFPIE